jgi:phenylalanine-4-hydroxylase
MRERGAVERERLLAIRDAAAEFTADWLLRAEVDELCL